MEAALNALWFLIALAGFCLWLRQNLSAAASQKARCSLLASLASLACALALVFPVISLTDDLRDEQAILEDSVGPSFKSLGNGFVSAKCSTPVAVIQSAWPRPDTRVAEWAISVEVLPCTSVFLAPLAGRAPPQFHS